MGSSRSRAEYAGLFFSEERSQRPGALLLGAEARTVHTPEHAMRIRNCLASGALAATTFALAAATPASSHSVVGSWIDE